MSFRRILGIIILVSGLGSIGTSLYIKKEVAKGKEQIASGQKKVDQTKALFGMSSATEPVGDVVTASGQSQINQGRRDVAYYEKLADWLMTGGIIGVIFGGLLLFFPSRKS
ncbi:MAG: hypothetical protein SNF33_08390 [Candidatus Algichlamydia australiensis]|nr:hypothetical protein [Chlamydiales bacterium]